ncbi:MAG TPA: hypothetical protein VH951_14330 [Dehalococcoidia bacterium]
MAVTELIASVSDAATRITLYTLSRRILVLDGGVAGGLDMAIEVADAGIAEVQTMIQAGGTDDQQRNLLRALHVLNFNLAADMCDCWPDDDRPRERRHHERGMEAALYLVGGAFDGMIESGALANDWWVTGMHQLSLGDPGGSRESWNNALRAAQDLARREGKPDRGSDSIPKVTLISGYLALAAWLTSNGAEREAAEAAFERAAGLFAAAQDDADARYSAGQLRKVAARYAPGLAS